MRSVAGGVEMAQNIGSSRRLSEYGDVRRISTEVKDEMVDPLERHLLITQAVVSNAFLARCFVLHSKLWTRSESKQTEAITAHASGKYRAI